MNLCNEAPFRFGKNLASRDPKSGALTARPRGRFKTRKDSNGTLYIEKCFQNESCRHGINTILHTLSQDGRQNK